MAEEQKQEEPKDWKAEKREGRGSHHSPFLIPAGVLIGLGVGILFNQAGAGVLIGLGLGFLGSALVPASREETATMPPHMHGSRLVPVLIGIFLVLVGLSIVSGWVLPWAYIIAAVLILIGLGFIARGFGWMR